TDRDDGVGALLQVEVPQFAQAVPIQCTLRIHGSDQRHHAARNHLPPPLPEKRGANGTVGPRLAQAKFRGPAIPLGGAFRYPFALVSTPSALSSSALGSLHVHPAR